jgi:putative flippase GtrA
MQRKDIASILIIGAAIGLLVQPILANNLSGYPLGFGARCGIFLFFAVFSLFALWVAHLISRVWRGIYEFAKFGAVGTLNSFIDIGIFNLETFLYGSSTIGLALFAVFKAASFLCATTNSFFWNKFWTFKSDDAANAKQVGSFYGIAVLGWVVNVGVATLAKALGPGNASPSFVHVWTNLVSPIAGILASFILNFVGYKYFVFKKK